MSDATRHLPPLQPKVEMWLNRRLPGTPWRERVLGGTPREVFEAHASNRQRITFPCSAEFARALSEGAEAAGVDRTTYMRIVLAAHFARVHGGDPEEWFERSYAAKHRNG